MEVINVHVHASLFLLYTTSVCLYQALMKYLYMYSTAYSTKSKVSSGLIYGHMLLPHATVDTYLHKVLKIIS